MSETTGRSKKIERHFKRYLGHISAEEIIVKAGEVLASSPVPDIDNQAADILKNFPQFVSVIEKSYEEYEERCSIANRNLQISSKELSQALKEVETLNHNINAMLDSLGQALLFFDENGICSPIYSKACLDILGQCPADKPVVDILGLSESAGETFTGWLNIVFSGFSAMDFDDLKALLPNEMSGKNKAIIEVDYKPIYLYDDKLTGVLLIATDVTEERDAKLKMQEMQRDALKIKQIAQDRNGFYALIADLYAFADSMRQFTSESVDGDDISSLKRALHTFKGQAGMYSLDNLSEKIHNIESDIRYKYTQNVPSKDLEGFALLILECIDEEKQYAQRIFGDDFMSKGKVKSVDCELMVELKTMLDEMDCPAENKQALGHFITEQFLSVKIRDLLSSFKREITRLCELSGKGLPEFNFQGENVSIVPEMYGEFFKQLIHLARNISDHALEAEEERVRKGKPPSGRVNISVERVADNLILTIADDGKGIDPEAIRKKLQENTNKDFSNEPDEEVIYHIFDADFSTRESAGMLSGRGIGMNAIQGAIQKIGGEIEVFSDYKNSKGTRFVFTMPYRM